MNPGEEQLFSLYDAFNSRDIERVIMMMHPLVAWANGMHGGFVHGREGVREYWKAQFQMIDPKLYASDYRTDEDDRALFTVRQVVNDLSGLLLLDKTVKHVFTFESGLIRKYEIEAI